jgi:hypothetical protein
MAGMKTRTIRRILRAKLDDWAASIEDKDLAKRALDGVIVTGGSIASMLLGETINDFDLYFKDKQIVADIARYYVSQFIASVPADKQGARPMPELRVSDDRVEIWIQSAGVATVEEPKQDYRYFELDDPGSTGAEDYMESLIKAAETDTADETKPKYRPVFMSANAISLSDKVQVVIRFWGSPEEIHKNYDFVHCCNWYDYKADHLELSVDALASLMSRTLRYQGSLYPVCSIFRTKKFIERGWRISAGEMLKMAMQVSELDMKNMDVFREQITGVDAAYFYQVLEAVQAASLAGQPVDSTYVATIIDRVFNL